MIRFCPNCKTEREVSELFCGGEIDGNPCDWDLSGEPLRPVGWRPEVVGETPATEASALRCVNGHPAEPGDLMCLTCGADILPIGEGQAIQASTIGAPIVPGAVDQSPQESTIVGEWQLERRIATLSRVRDRYFANHISDGRRAVLTLYSEGSEPDPEVYDVLRSLDRDHVPEIYSTGRWQDRMYEVAEDLRGGTLADVGLLPDDEETLSRILSEIGSALAALAECGLRHRDLRPGVVLVRSRDPLDLVITGFGSARLSEFDLDIVAPLETTRYTAPEAVAGGVAAASDWWSLGMLLLEQVTRGACFEGVDDQTFLIHVLSNGAPIPKGLRTDVEVLLRGLLARDRRQRWGWSEVRRWLDGESPPAPESVAEIDQGSGRHTLGLGSRRYKSRAAFALDAAQAGNWNEACDLLIRGEVATWAEDAGFGDDLVTELRKISRLEKVSEDLRLAYALTLLNPAMPLVCRGAIVSPSWLLDHPEEGYALIAGPLPDLLEKRDTELWLPRLKRREERVRERAKHLNVELDEPVLRANLLSTSSARLSALWNERSRLLPDTDHPGLLAIIDRRITAEEDFILLLSADMGHFETAEAIIAKAADAARQAGIHDFDKAAALVWLHLPRRELYATIETRLEGFARCGYDRIDSWADQFRVERRLPTGRALAILAVPEGEWRQPPKQSYIANLLDFYGKRISVLATRGPLTRMVIGKTTARIDLTELGSARKTATSLLDHILLRSDQPFEVDPDVFLEVLGLERRIRTLHSHATLYRRDTGIDGLFLGFPFLVSREPGIATTRPRVAPILLWPVKLRPEVGRRGRVFLEFDRGREEVRLNPAFETLFGPEAAESWNAVAQELLGRSSVTTEEVLAAFSELAPRGSKSVVALPGKEFDVAPGERRLFGSAVLFHLAFIGQAVNKDLRDLKAITPLGSALETMLRLGDEVPNEAVPEVSHLDRYFTAASDPSQERAVIEARGNRGLLVEGPPGTGKSQTIVNMVADAIGRQRSLLIVCQKQAALEVVHKRLEAEGLGNRIVMVTDVQRDRLPIIGKVREQVESLRARSGGAFQVRQREQVAARLTALEADLDGHHRALFDEDAATGLSYRQILTDLIVVAETGPYPALPVLRQRLAPMNPSDVALLQEACAPIARLWLPARYEGSALAALKSFGYETATVQAFTDAFIAFQRAEIERAQVSDQTPHALSVHDPEPFRRWSAAYAPRLIHLAEPQRERLVRWVTRFEISGGEDKGQRLIGEMTDLAGRLAGLREEAGANEATVAHDLGVEELVSCGALAEEMATTPSFLQRLSIARFLRAKRQSDFLQKHGIADEAVWRIALREEQAVRPLRERLAAAFGEIGEPDILARRRTSELARLASERLGLLSEVQELAQIMRAHPDPTAAVAAARGGTRGAIERLIEGSEQGYARFEARRVSAAALDSLKIWMDEAWAQESLAIIARDGTTALKIAPILDALPTLGAYQRFRARAGVLTPEAIQIFAALRPIERDLAELTEDELDLAVRRLLTHESRLAWKTRLEAERPVLMFEATELESKTRAMAEADRELREMNRRLLIDGIDVGELGSVRDWEDITRLRGQRTRRLREFLEKGEEIGLMRLRPIWLMNPDVASRLLPLRKAFFDTVIYDEASQMPVEYALPTLFRARKAVVSGDDKQMPPTSFFASKIESDEAQEYEGEMEEDGEEAEREEMAETWNRREIKDCPDLLNLAQSVLPHTTLQIHYRSAYRELIQFSNPAFYKNSLSIPVRHPEAEIRRVRPIELHQVDGLYENQSNRVEAERVVEFLAEQWQAPFESRRTTGVVTFNRKQADLIEEVLDERAMFDAAFARALGEERERMEKGEDMSFFVKNVENVQGDERDVVIFSSTFGRNRQNTFRRSFGVLGQTGGQRRLNVAVTRAREKVVLISSMPIGEISDFLKTRRTASSPRDYLQAYFEYARMVSEGELASAESLRTRLCDHSRMRSGNLPDDIDGFHNAVRDEVRRMGWEPVPVPDEGVFGLDFAIEDPRTGLYGIGIECDAPRHPLLGRARARELWRPSILGRSIPRLHRVSSHRWFGEPEREKARLREAIEAALGSEVKG